MSVGSGTIYHIHEVVDSLPGEFEGASVKLLGHLRFHDPMAMRASLVLGDASIAVDTSLIQRDGGLVEGTLYHLIGELSSTAIGAGECGAAHIRGERAVTENETDRTGVGGRAASKQGPAIKPLPIASLQTRSTGSFALPSL